MDQVKKFLAVLAKYHFWILSVLAAIVCLTGWYLASASLTQKYEENKRTVEAQFSNLNTVISESAHPNDVVNQGIKKQTDAQRRRVYEVWRNLYEKQKKDVLFWPPELGKSFLGRIEGLKFGDPLPTKMRERYMNYIKTRFEELPQIVEASQESIAGVGGARRSLTARRPLGGGEGNEGEPEDSFKVHWRNYSDLEQRLLWQRTPASLMVWLTQEDLWVYETLLRIIAATNRSATGHHDAPIKEITRLLVGQDAAALSKTSGRLWKPGQSSREGGSFSEPGGAISEEERGGIGDGQGEGDDPEAKAKALTVRRYLNEEGQPIEEASTGDDTRPFKRLPIYMELRMDERELPKLLAECANATLPVEVRQVRINPGAAVDASGFGEGQRSVSPREGGEAAEDPAVVPVVIQGIIYIFNPPNREVLGLPAEDQPVADASAPPADT